MEGEKAVVPDQEQLGRPFRISNTGLDHVVRYLTLNKPHEHEKRRIAQFDAKRTGEGEKDQIWYIERTNDDAYFRIRHDHSLNSLHKNLYLTLTQGTGKLENQPLVELTELKNEEGSELQLWSFDLGENYRFVLKIGQKINKTLYLESTEVDKLEEGYKTVLRLKNEAEHGRRFLQFWKLSPVFDDLSKYTGSAQTEAASLQIDVTEIIKEEYKFHIFKGKIYRKGHPEYDVKKHQYATTSYPAKQMSPFLLVYPTNVVDIACVLKLAKELKKNVVARSGGHQYSGLSSGGDGTIVLSMDAFTGVHKNADGLIEIGPCTPLKEASKNLQKLKVSIPHGECPLVNVGGHAQTGGYGIFIHSFGLCLDYIEAFEIVLASGEFKKVVRPKVGVPLQTQEERDNFQLFRGVLGGNAGSFGIVTKYYFNSIKDEAHPHSFSFSKVRFYNKKLFREVMQVYQQWTRLSESGNEESLKGLDLEFTVSQLYVDVWRQRKVPILLLEGIYSDPDGKTPYNHQFKEIYDKFMSGITLIEKGANSFLKRYNDHMPLSQAAGRHVRQYPMVTQSGREFDLPYEKRTNLTMSALTDEFINEFIDQVSFVADSKLKSIVVVVQMVHGSGVCKEKGKITVDGQTITSIPHRTSLHNFVYDLFYNTSIDPNAQKEAKKLQDKMQKTVDEHYSTKGVGEKRFFWACFDDFDMRKQEVILKYYDSVEAYKVLQKLKDRVDPDNLFNTPITVKPSNVPIIPINHN